MRFRAWYRLRGPRYAAARAALLLQRYGFTPTAAMARVEGLMATLAGYGTAPTLPTPGRVVELHPVFLRHLQDDGAEIAVHSYHHVDLAAYEPAGAAAELTSAARAFVQNGLEVRGFRCPYLRVPEGLWAVLPAGLFDYASNWAVQWETLTPQRSGSRVSPVLETLQGFYDPASADEVACIPHWKAGAPAGGSPAPLEIPACVPDDLQLLDGLGLDSAGITSVWCQTLCRTHGRGELFDVVVHPELAELYCDALAALMEEARGLRPAVWLARLRDVSDWWREKSAFSVEASERPGPQPGLHLAFNCSARASVLVRGIAAGAACLPWDERYACLVGRELDLPAGPLPFLGLPAGTPAHLVDFLRDQGYLIATGEQARRCGICLDLNTVQRNEVELIEAIEAADGPLVRFGRWPHGAKSALVVSGDLDALTLFDYAERLLVH